MTDKHDAAPDPAPATPPPEAAAPAATPASPSSAPSSAPRAAAASAGREPGASWEREVLDRLLNAALNEQRRARRWGIFFKLAFLAYLTPLLIVALGLWSPGMGKSASAARHTALVDVKGVIEVDGEASAEAINAALRAAFEDARTAGVVVRLNTPGGSPVQAGMVHDEIRRLRALRPKKPVYVVVEDMCASGCYYIAAAADRIYVSQASVVGSIGVLMSSFGFTGLMQKLGIERRLMTAGENKAMMDPFSAQNPQHREHTQLMLREIHQQFIAAVKAGRGKRLKNDPDIFSGLFWTGSRAISLGLADGLGTVDSVARDVLKAEDVIDYTVREGLSDRVLKKFGAAVGESMAKTIAAETFRPR